MLESDGNNEENNRDEAVAAAVAAAVAQPAEPKAVKKKPTTVRASVPMFKITNIKVIHFKITTILSSMKNNFFDLFL